MIAVTHPHIVGAWTARNFKIIHSVNRCWTVLTLHTLLNLTAKKLSQDLHAVAHT